MTDLPIQLIVLLNSITNALGDLFLAPVSNVPGWFSITVISGVMGVLLLVIFKYTSNQAAIAGIRDDVKANMLAIKLFKDNFRVIVRSQAKVFFSSFKLLYHSIVPMLVMVMPVSLVMAQMGLWYQARPVHLKDAPVIVKLKLNSNVMDWPQVTLNERQSVKIIAGPVRVVSRKEIYWKIKPLRNGYHYLTFQVGNQKAEKQFAVGSGFMRLSLKRPGPEFIDTLLFPLEKPFAHDAAIHSIGIDYPERESRIYGKDWWIVYFFITSIVSALIFKPLIKVKI
jgi:uncharacterized membrane protein (DUF106 family)